MTEVISIRFKNKGKVYYFDPAGQQYSEGDNVIVETSKGLEYTWCSEGNHEVDDSLVVQPLMPAVRKATPEDDARYEENKKKEAEAFTVCEEKILKHGMDMKLVDVEYSFDGSKILFFFTSDGRVDFRDLVKDLASVFKTRIELRQIGVRDESRMLGGLGICGRPFCCSQFLDEFHPVSIKMAKTQGLSLNPAKISGTCGRLMCCLKYEQAAYEDLIKHAPKIDAFVDTVDGKGSIVGVNLFRGNAKVRLEDSNDNTLHTYAFDDLEVLGGKARRAEYIAAKAEGRLEEAGFRPSPKPKEDPMPEVTFVSDNGTDEEEPVPVQEAPAEQHRADQGKHSSRRGRDRNRHGGQKPKSSPESGSDNAAEKAQSQDDRPKQEHSSHSRRHRSGGKKPKVQAQEARSIHPKQDGQQQKPPKQVSGQKQPREGQSEQQGGAQKKKNSRHRYYRRKKPSGQQHSSES